jgi:hypothetical protein
LKFPPEARIPLLSAIDAYLQKSDDDLKKQLQGEGFIEPEYTVDKINEVERKIEEALHRELSAVERALAECISLETFNELLWPDVKQRDTLAEDLGEIFEDYLGKVVPQLSDAYLLQTDKALVTGFCTDRTTAWIESWSRELGEMMKLTSHEEIGKILTEQLKKGAGIAETARAIQESGIRETYTRARTTALTETLRAHNVAHQESMIQAPAVTHKRWRHTGSFRNTPRENHVAMDGQIVPKDQPFVMQGRSGATYAPQYPVDSSLPAEESINCHCLAQEVTDLDIMQLPEEDRQKLQLEAIAADNESFF